MSLTCNNNICMSLDGTRPEKGPWEVGKETENFNCLDTLTFKPKKSITNVIIAEVWPCSRGWMLPQEQQTLLPWLLWDDMRNLSNVYICTIQVVLTPLIVCYCSWWQCLSAPGSPPPPPPCSWSRCCPPWPGPRPRWSLTTNCPCPPPGISTGISPLKKTNNTFYWNWMSNVTRSTDSMEIFDPIEANVRSKHALSSQSLSLWLRS